MTKTYKVIDALTGCGVSKWFLSKNEAKEFISGQSGYEILTHIWSNGLPGWWIV